MRTIRVIPWVLFLVPILLIPDGSAQDLKINEVQYTNRNTLYDSDNDSPDWIEIINVSDKSINLSAYQLTDDSTTSIGWNLPNLDLAPDSVMLIFASGKNKHSMHELHTNFKLNLMEDPVILMDSKGRILDRIDPQCVPPDASLGRWPDGSNALKILTPTPGTSNNSAEVREIEYVKDS
ncbi:MAG: lamin tail domain-containing protein, partial [Bacteroidales bacterium]|nr:lamin tail domain-containing protein [Bacteroidales bacterium]